MSSFENLRVVDNFYQTSLFFPMPTVVISTLCEDGTTTLGPYSLVQPYYVAGKDFYAMLLSCRNSSNTAQNILRNGKCAINFVDDKPKTFKECVKLSWPGDKPEDKMPGCNFRLEPGLVQETPASCGPRCWRTPSRSLNAPGCGSWTARKMTGQALLPVMSLPITISTALPPSSAPISS